MIIDLIDKLIGHMIALFRENLRAKKQVHDEFALPLMQHFESVHKNYMDTFSKYRDMIKNQDRVFDSKYPVFVEMAKDSLFTQDFRAKLGALWRTLGQRGCSQEIADLLESILRYLSSSMDSPVPRNFPRGSVFLDLQLLALPSDERWIFEGELYSRLDGSSPETEAVRIIEDQVHYLQQRYASVQAAYQQFKIKYVK